jgi:hypothetical protein
VRQYIQIFIEALDLTLGFLEMGLHRRFQLRGTCSFGHFRQGFQKLLLGMQDVAQLIDEKFLDRPRAAKRRLLTMGRRPPMPAS